jgi:hypothetical protein
VRACDVFDFEYGGEVQIPVDTLGRTGRVSAETISAKFPGHEWTPRIRVTTAVATRTPSRTRPVCCTVVAVDGSRSDVAAVEVDGNYVNEYEYGG